MNATATKLTKGAKYDLSTLTCVDWTGDDTGLDCWAYFADGVYLGPDADGVEPLFAVAVIRVYIDTDAGQIVRDAESQWDALQMIQEHHPSAVAVGPWCLRLSGQSEREYAASDDEGAPIVARMVR